MTSTMTLAINSPVLATLLLFTANPKATASVTFTSSCFAGGGFGAPKSAPPKKVKKKKSIVDELKPPTPIPIDTAPKLDRFGLPIATEEDIFPPLPNESIRTPVKNPNRFDKSEAVSATRNHLGVNLTDFDERGYSLHAEQDTKWKLNLVHANPPVFTIDNFFTKQECIEYMNMVNPSSKEYREDNTISITSPTFANSISRRTSTTYFCRYSAVPTLLAKILHLFGDTIDLHQCEEPQIVRYETGQEFSWHYDEIPKNQLENGGQRLATLLVYLNDVKADGGGATVFRDLTSSTGRQLKVQPKQGTALLFFPSYDDGMPDERTLHKGQVALDEKMIAQVWIHERDYVASVPVGNVQEDAVEGVDAEYDRLFST